MIGTSDKSHYQQFIPPFEIPDSWEWVQIAEIGEIVTGNTPPKDIQEYYGGEISFFKPTDLEQGIETVYSSDHLSDLGYKQARPLPVNTILITCIGATIGKTGLIKREGACNQQINAIIPVAQINPEYIYFSCISGYFQAAIRENASATTLPILNKFNFSSLLLPIPPVKEQDRIIKQIYRLLEELIEIETSEERLGTAINIAKSKILDLAMQGKIVPQDPTDEPAADMLRRINPKAKIITDNPQCQNLPSGWAICELRDLCKLLSRGKSPKYSDEPNLYPVFAQKCNLKDGGISLNLARFLDESTLDKWPDKYHLSDGDILINSTGTGTVGRTRIFDESCLGNYPFVVPDSHVSVVRTFNEICSKFIFYCLYSNDCQRYFEENLAGSTNQKELYIDVIGDRIIMLPPLTEQYRIVTMIENLYSVLDSIKTSLQS